MEMLHCRLEDGILTTEITTITRDSDDYRYEDFILEILPYGKYTELFGIEPGSLAEEDYRAFIHRLFYDSDETPLDLDFEQYVQRLSRFGGRTALNRDTYESACEKAREAGLIPLFDFMDRISRTETEIYRFDARTKKDLP
jgi:hypothetical protein